MLMLCSNIFCILNCTNFVWKHNNSSLFYMQNELKLKTVSIFERIRQDKIDVDILFFSFGSDWV